MGRGRPFGVPQWAVDYFEALTTIANAAGTDIRVPAQKSIRVHDINVATALGHVLAGRGPILVHMLQATFDLSAELTTELAHQSGLPRELTVPFTVVVGDSRSGRPPFR